MIYGANLSSGINFVLLAKTHRGEAAQIALMQFPAFLLYRLVDR